MSSKPITLSLGEFQIQRVRRVEIDGRPQLVIDVKATRRGGNEMTVVLTRQMAQELTEALGPDATVEKFFSDGEGLQ